MIQLGILGRETEIISVLKTSEERISIGRRELACKRKRGKSSEVLQIKPMTVHSRKLPMLSN